MKKPEKKIPQKRSDADDAGYKKTVSKLQKSKQRFRIIFENSLAVMLLIDPETHRIISANKEAGKFYGWSRLELEKMRIDDINTLTPAEIKTEMEKARKSERIYFRFKHRLADGELRDVEVYSGKVEINGKDYLHSIIHDVTEQVKAEDALKNNEKVLRLFVEHSPASIAMFDTQMRYMVYSKRFLADYDLGERDITGMTHYNVFPEIPQRWKDIHQRGLKGEILSADNDPFPRANGKMDWIRWEIHPWYKNEKEIGGIILFSEVITEKQKSEEALRKSEEQYRTLFETMTQGVVYQRANGEIISANPAAEKILGLSIDQMMGRTSIDPRWKAVDEKKNPLPGEKHPAMIALQTGKEVQNFTQGIFNPQKNEYVWILVNSIPQFKENEKEPYQVFSTFLDITDRKKAEEALSHSHELMKYIIEHNQSAVAVHDKNLNYVYVSQRYLDDYRVKKKDIIGKHHYEVFPDIPEKWRKVHQKALKGIVSRANEDKFYREDGTLDWTRWECRPWYEADGSIGGIIIYTEVINEQKRKEEEIKKLNLRLEILIDSIHQLSSAQSLDSVQDIVAKSARKLIGADGATLVFREDDNCFYVNEDAIQPLWKGKRFPLNSCISGWVMLNKEPVVIEDIYADERIPKEVYNPTFVKSLAMVPVNISEPIGAIGNYWKEIYTPTENEMQLLQTLADAAARAIENINLYAELEDRVKLRTEQLQAANKELETFTYSVSHDLKAPLRGIDGYSKLLMDEYGESLNEEAAHFIRTIRSSTLQMNRLIEDLLSYSRLERSHFKQEKIALKSFIETLVSNFSEEITKGRFKVEMNIPKVEIVADSTGLSIALRNFLENAIKFTAAKPNPKVEIGLEEKPDVWIISVKDNGVGFEMKYHDRIFDIFQRLHRAEDFPGTGIGLAMVAKAMQRMGGKAWAKSTPGNGATFFIELPKNKSI